MKQHPEVGHRICLPLERMLGAALLIIRHHHEKLDGSGYPDGLSGAEIPMAVRAMVVADVYDALISDRPYRDAMGQDEALALINEQTAAGKLDVDVVSALHRVLEIRRSEHQLRVS